MIGVMICLLFATASFIFYAPTIEECSGLGATTTSTTGCSGAMTIHQTGVYVQDILYKASFGFCPARSKLLWGAYAGDELSSAPQFESLVGSTMDLQPVFIGWYELFPSKYGPSVRERGKTLVIFWEQYDVTLDEIVNGSADTYIDAFASAAKEYKGQIMLVPFHEMNGEWSPWSGVREGNSQAQVIAAWRHVHKRFAGIPNVKFAWNVNNGSQPDTPQNAIARYYPGDAYVDYVAVNGFNDGNPWQSWSDVFDDALRQLRIYHKPIYILSMASAQGSMKAEWITDALTVQIPQHPEIAGWIWFHANKEANWLVNSDERSLVAFATALLKQ